MNTRWGLYYGIGLLFCTVNISLKAQEKHTSEESPKGSSQLSPMLGHSHLFTGIKKNGNKGWLVLPSWGLDYHYWIGRKWALGIQSDIITETFEVEKENKSDEVLERTSPVALMASGAYRPFRHQTFTVCMGAEFAKEGNFLLNRLGYDYGWEMRNSWELSLCVTYDLKWNAYDTWTFGISVSKYFRKK